MISIRLLAQIGLGLILFASLTGMSIYEPEVHREVHLSTYAGYYQALFFLLALIIAVVISLKVPHGIRGFDRFLGGVLLAFIAWCFLSSFWSVNISTSLYRSAQISLALFLVFYFVHLLDKPKLVFDTIVAVCLVIVVINIVGTVVNPDASFQKYTHPGALKGMHSHKNVAGRVMGLCTVVLFWVWMSKRGWGNRHLLALIGSLGFVVLTQSRAALFSVCVAIVFGLVVRAIVGSLKGTERITSIALLFSFAVLIPLLLLTFGYVDELLNSGSVDLTVSNRSAVWALLLSLVSNSPILGQGYGGVWDIGGSPIEREGYGWFVFAHQGHNGFLDTAVAVGLPITLLLTYFVLKYFLVPLKWPRSMSLQAGTIFSILAFCLLVNLAESAFFDRWRGISVVLIVGLALCRKQDLALKEKVEQNKLAKNVDGAWVPLS